jgi:LacI family transcriptional regulator
VRRIGVHDIARRARVSIGTVDRALHGRAGISQATRDKVLRIARSAGYTPNLTARALSVRRSILRVGVCIPEEIHFFYDQMRAGIEDEARRGESLGVEFIYRPVPSLGEHEKRQVSALLREELHALVVVPGNPKVVTPLINRAEASGVRVVCISTDAPLSRRSTVVCVNPELNGRLAAELMAKFGPPGAEVSIITGMLATEDHRRKTEGFQTGFSAYSAGGKVLAVLEAHESEEESYQKTCELLAREKRLAGIYVNTVNCLPVCRAVQQHRRDRQLRLITTDLFRQMVPFIENGTIGASVYQDPYRQGRDAVRIVLDHLLEKAAIAPTSYLNPAVVLRSNLYLFREVAGAFPPPAPTRAVRPEEICS